MFNSWLPESKDHLPLTWWKTNPVYLSAIVALVGAASMVVYAILGVGVMERFCAFTFNIAFRDWHVWTVLTYPLVNPPSLWTLFGCYLLWNFGEAVERHLGRRAFVRLLLTLTLSSPVFLTIFGLHNSACAGIQGIDFGTFIAFATLYPRAKISIIILTLDAWVLAAILVGVDVLSYLSMRSWVGILLLAANVGIAYAFIRYETGALRLPSLPKRVSSPKGTQQPQKSSGTAKSSKSSTPSVDDILDKISHKGMQSLTAEERRILDKASEDMKRQR
ncbi:rhomboid family intramembrane serine protease [Prosthecobacter sp.]|uniref:rhomboid family intramembrane serine protease n=1 Tax=Prosthecobacter sp. TaxID=1965333 RepID=UPI003785161C